MLNFVGDINGNNSANLNSAHNSNMAQYYQSQQQHLFYLNNKFNNETINKSPTPYSSSYARRELLLNELKQQQQQHQQQPYDYEEVDMESDRLFYKRRSITSSPVRYNFNSKSSPPVIMRIDSAKTAKLNRLRAYEQQQQQQLNESNINSSTNYDQQVTTPSNLQSWPNNNLR